MPLLEVEHLSVSFHTPDGIVQAVRDLSFTVEAGKTLGVVGESGSGKSVMSQTIMGLTTGARVGGQAVFDGKPLFELKPEALQAIRGAEIAMIFQDPLSSLHPYYRVGWQIVELLRAHDDGISKKAAREKAVELLKIVGIPQPERRVNDFPHQFSGGMRQRAMIAMAISMNPKLLIADEPTTALDVTVQAQVLDVLERIQREFGTAIIMITHDLGVIAEIADDVIVMYAGSAMEKSGQNDMFYAHHHPYTEGLLESLPAYGDERARLRPISGQPPSLINLPTGCPYQTRCPYVMRMCREEAPPLRQVFGDTPHLSACWLPTDRDARDAARAALVAGTYRGATDAAVTGGTR
ncbi:MAG: transporter ATP-binding protein [Frankiales bacterium]|nr:transporter ATP-binding protein [Frankiales bacterium]